MSFSLFGHIVSTSAGAGLGGAELGALSGSGRGSTLARLNDFLLHEKPLSATQSRELFGALSGDCRP